MARISRKNMPGVVTEPSDNLTTKALLQLKNEEKPYRVALYARLSNESEANRERDTVETQISYIKNYVSDQTDMIIVDIYADISVTGTDFNRPEFERLMQDIKEGKINTVITRDLSRLGRNYIETGNYIERVFPFFNVRYIAITDDFDSERPGTDLSMPLKNIVNEFYARDISKKINTAFQSIWRQGGFCSAIPPYGFARSPEDKQQLVIDEEAGAIVKRIFQMFIDGTNYAQITKTLQQKEILSPPKYRFTKGGKTEFAEKARSWHETHVRGILRDRHYVGDCVHGKITKSMETGKKNRRNPKENWIIISDTHEAIIEKEVFEQVQEKMEGIKIHQIERTKSKGKPAIPKNKFRGKIVCGECGASMGIRRRWHKLDEFFYCCYTYSKSAKMCSSTPKGFYQDLEKIVFDVIHKHMAVCVDKLALVHKLNQQKVSIMQYDVYSKEITRLRREMQRNSAKKCGLYEDYRDGLINEEELCQYQQEYENAIKAMNEQVEELLSRQIKYEKEFHMDANWEEKVNLHMKKRKLTQEMIDTFVSKVIILKDGSIEVHLIYDDFLHDLIEIAKEREGDCNGAEDHSALHETIS